VFARKWSVPAYRVQLKRVSKRNFWFEEQFSLHLVEQVGTCSPAIAKQVAQTREELSSQADCLRSTSLVLSNGRERNMISTRREIFFAVMRRRSLIQ